MPDAHDLICSHLARANAAALCTARECGVAHKAQRGLTRLTDAFREPQGVVAVAIGACHSGRHTVSLAVESPSPDRWWEDEKRACPAGATAQGFANVHVACFRTDGSRHGRITCWNGSSRVYDGQFRDDRRDGRWTIWSPGGAPVQTRIYDRGQLIKIEQHARPSSPAVSCPTSSRDCDGDGVDGAADMCPDSMEDLDGWMDDDGCPDPDFDDVCPVEVAPCVPGG